MDLVVDILQSFAGEKLCLRATTEGQPDEILDWCTVLNERANYFKRKKDGGGERGRSQSNPTRKKTGADGQSRPQSDPGHRRAEIGNVVTSKNTRAADIGKDIFQRVLSGELQTVDIIEQADTESGRVSSLEEEGLHPHFFEKIECTWEGWLYVTKHDVYGMAQSASRQR